jgi:hypothetical protein
VDSHGAEVSAPFSLLIEWIQFLQKRHMSSVANVVIHASQFLENSMDKFPDFAGKAAAELKGFLEARSAAV